MSKKHKKVTVKKSSIWQGASAVLAILLVISIYTHGFRSGPSIDSVKGDVDTLIQQQTDEGVITTLQGVKEELATLAVVETETSEDTENAQTDVAQLDFYVMSQCPYGTQVVDAIAPVVEQLGDRLDFNMHYIVTDNGDGTFRSLHGEPEVKGNIVQLCAMNYHPETYLDMVVCQNKDMRGIPANWETCAEDAELDVATIKACYEGEEGKELLRASIEETNKVGATGSPTMYLNGEKYSGGRQTTQFLQAICETYENKPEACSNLPEPTKVKMIVLSDARCEECDVTQLVSQLKGLFPGLAVQYLDYAEPEGSSLYEETGVTLLPALLFDETVKEGEGYANVERYLQEAGSYTSLRIGASFDPTSEICDNDEDDTGNGLIDCADPTCQNTLSCRDEIEGRLDLFVMSQCPFGTQALDSMEEVLENVDVEFHVNFIATDNGDGTFQALHGQPEVDENIRELCAIKYYPDDYKYMDYIWCRNKDIQSTDWEPCAQEAGMSATMIRNCFEGEEGKELLRQNIKLANDLGVSASPTWMTNNRVQFSGLDPETIKQNFCSENPDAEGCEKTLTSTTATPAGNC